MYKARYIIRITDGELFGWNPDYLKLPGMVEYNPALHGYRSEVAAQMGLADPSQAVPPGAPAISINVSEHAAGQAIPATTAATKVSRKKSEAQPPEPDLSDVFDPK